MERSISNSASIRRTTLIAMGESGISFLPAALRRALQPTARSQAPSDVGRSQIDHAAKAGSLTRHHGSTAGCVAMTASALKGLAGTVPAE